MTANPSASVETDDAPAEDQAAAPAAPAEMYDAAFTGQGDQVVLHPNADAYVSTIETLKADGFVSIVDLCGVDYLTNGTRRLPDGIAPERFEVVVSLIAHQPPRRIRVRLQVPEADPSVPTLFDLYPGVENMEREAYDMFGIVFDNHPDPTRILMPEDWDGYPLRKDFGIGSVPVQFKGAPAPR